MQTRATPSRRPHGTSSQEPVRARLLSRWMALLAAGLVSPAWAGGEITLPALQVTAKGYAADPLATANAVESLAPSAMSGVAGGLFVG